MPLISTSFSDLVTANDAVDRLLKQGQPPDRITIAMGSENKQHLLSHGGKAEDADATRGAAGGSLIGGSLGAILGLLALGGTVAATAGSTAPLIIGPMALLAGAGAGAAAGGVIGGIVGGGLPEERVIQEPAALEQGRIAVVVDATENDVPEVQRVLQEAARSEPPPR